MSSPLATVTNESNPTTYTLSEINASFNATTTIMMKLIAPDSGQSQLRVEASIHIDTPNIKNYNKANYDLFEDFLDTYFRSPTCQHNDLSIPLQQTHSNNSLIHLESHSKCHYK